MFKVIWSHQLHRMPKPGWLVQGLIPAADDGCCGMICGREGSYKSFIALDLACHIAQSRDAWMGHRIVRPGPVLYVAAERMSEMPKRIEAWKEHYNRNAPVTGVGICPEPILLQQPMTINDLTDTLDQQFPERPRLIIMDTLAKCITGVDENSASEVGVVTANLDRIQRRYGATIILLHHLNKAGQSRGSNSLNGHVTFEMHVQKKGDLTAQLDFRKMSVGAEPEALRLQMKRVLTAYGETLVVGNATVFKAEPKEPKKEKPQKPIKMKEPTTRERIAALLRESQTPLKPQEISAKLGIKDGTTREVLRRMVDNQEALRGEEDGRYFLPR